ncbi:AraC family transcriptional regulator [Paenibacillus alkalitolerans]|uniref:AraC family transcriptional regulator n=1 Tax=Paenibacillus alkalitolerans TaxID=2799335 RepID=UPI0018F582BE|nr:AraC family transcriptional regulator [Paenibacillus alkalitolerans]
MPGVNFFRDESVPFLEIKFCNDKSLSYKKHFHEEYSIGVIDEGSSSVWCDGKNIDVGAGRFIWIPPYLPHACNPREKSDWKYKMLFIRPEWMNQALGAKEENLHEPFLFENETNQLLKRYLNDMIRCLKSRKTPLETETVAIEMVDMIRNGRAVKEKRPGDGCQAKQSLIRVKDYLHEHYLERVTLEQFEKVSGISRFHLLHSFKKEHNIPPHAYQNLLRINFAKKELRKRRPIAEIAAEAGFYDQSHFTKLFKGYVGVTPHKYAISM